MTTEKNILENCDVNFDRTDPQCRDVRTRVNNTALTRLDRLSNFDLMISRDTKNAPREK